MEGSPDIVPPTPNIQPRKVCARVNKASVTSTKLSRKLLKSDPNGCKRKRLPNSPDYKKVKQKVKQVTLLNFVVKTNKVDNLNPRSSKTVISPAKINLLNKFEEVERKNDALLQTVCKDINKDSYQIERQTSPHVNQCMKEVCEENRPHSSNNVTSPVKINLLNKFEKLEKKNDAILQMACEDINKDSCQIERQIPAQECVKVCEDELRSSKNGTSPAKVNLFKNLEVEGKNDTLHQMACSDINKDNCQLESQISPCVNQCVKEVCEEVASLNLSSENKDLSRILTNNDNVNKESNFCHVEVDEYDKKKDLLVEEMPNSMDQEVSKDVDQTFSWMTDELWESEKENFNLSNHPPPEMSADFNDEL